MTSKYVSPHTIKRVEARQQTLRNALAAEPEGMTLHALARATERDQTSVWWDLDKLRTAGVTETFRVNHGNGRPSIRWRLSKKDAD